MDAQELLKRLRFNGTNSDLTIICGSKEYKLHKNIICESSSVFKTACNEEKWQKSKNAIIRLEQKFEEDGTEDYSSDHPEAVKLLVDFIYLGDYALVDLKNVNVHTAVSSATRGSKKDKHRDGESLVSIAEPLGPLERHARMFAMGSKYIIPSLKSAAVKKYNETIKATAVCPKDLAIATRIAYKTGNDHEPAMKNAVLASIVKHSSKIMKEPEIREAIDISDQLAIAVIEALANHCSCHSSYKGCSGDGLAQDQCGICQSWGQERCYDHR